MALLGYSIRILRQARELSGAQLAEKAEISAAYLSLIESEERVPPDATLVKIADALVIDPELLRVLVSESASHRASFRVRELRGSLRKLAAPRKT